MRAYGKKANLVTACCTSAQKASDFAKRHGFSGSCTDYRSVITDKDILTIVICTPAGTHKEIISLASKAGKNIFCEKPLAWTLEEAEAAVDECRSAGVKLAVADQYRFFPHIAAAAKIIRSGTIGRVVSAHIDSAGYFTIQPYPGQTRGFVVEQLSHLFDVLSYLIGNPVVSVYSQIGRSPARPDVYKDHREFSCDVLLQFASGAKAAISASWDCLGFDITQGQLPHGPEGRIRIECERGTVMINRHDGPMLEVYRKLDGKWTIPLVQPSLTIDQLEPFGTGKSMSAFIEWIESGPEHPVSGLRYLHVMRIVDAVYRSAETGTSISIGDPA